MKRYDPKIIEPKWQKTWEETKLYEVKDFDPRPKWYQLEFFPYPSGVTMHVGHVRNYAISDTIARYKRMGGHNVLHPMGWDAFGLPAENQAIKTGQPPRESTDANIKVFKRQLQQVGLSYDWTREIDSSKPDYYRWTQWQFLRFYKLGLAYRDKAWVNWCPHDKTVLANEQVIKKDAVNVCERCGQAVERRELEQWFFKITQYADRLLQDLDALDWPEGIKAMQRNWIGRSAGALVEFPVVDHKAAIEVFTTRIDTIYSGTFIVLAPEHELIEKIVTKDQREAVAVYVQEALNKTDLDRMGDDKDKSGVFTGAYAVNPASKEKIPIWIAEFVLGGYGAGAVFGDGHDERDVAFAQEHGIPLKTSVQPISIDTVNPPREGAKPTTRNVAMCVVRNPKDDTYLTLKWKQFPWHTFITGGIEEGEDVAAAAQREITEETGYKNLKLAGVLPFTINSRFYAAHKDVNRDITMNVLRFELVDAATVDHQREDHEDFEVVWVKRPVLDQLSPVTELPMVLKWLDEGDYVYSGDGRLIDSGPYTGLDSATAREKMTRELGREQVNYKMRDWLISRQRYWGAPIPVVHCQKDGIVPVPEDQLPVELPPLDNYQPADDGRSPLARATDWLHTTCPQCGGPAQRETDTMDTFVDSSWYYLRFADPHNDHEPFGRKQVNYWLPVDSYVGGAEHAVAHLLFARFWTKVLRDQGMVDFGEPFKSLHNQGMIGGADGRKMGKRYGNVVTPDELIDQGYGADALRLYELFIGPHDQAVDWNPNGIDGTKRFLNRVWALVQEHLETKGGESGSGALETAVAGTVHKTIKKVTVDLQHFSFNTAIAAMMETVNELYKLKLELPLGSEVWSRNLRLLVQILAPFAPHISEELWQELGGEESVHVSGWPTFDPELVRDELMTIVLQVNGKVRSQLEMGADASEEEIVAAAQADTNIARHLEGKSVTKTIYVPGKLVNFVVK